MKMLFLRFQNDVKMMYGYDTPENVNTSYSLVSGIGLSSFYQRNFAAV